MLKKFGSWIVDTNEIREVIPLVGELAARVFFKGDGGAAQSTGISQEQLDALVVWVEAQADWGEWIIKDNEGQDTEPTGGFF